MGRKRIAYINPKMLTWARGETPFISVEDVAAQKKSLKAEKISKWENGEDLPSIKEARELAALYKVPLAAFYLSNPPEKKPKIYTDRRTYNDTVYRETSYSLWKEINRVLDNRELIIDYSAEEYEDCKLPLFPDTFTVSRIASEMRRYFGINLPFKNKNVYKNGFNYFRSILEDRGIIISQISGVSLDEMKGLSVHFERFPIIAVNNKDYERAKVFSLFHELAHLIRRSSSLCLIDFDDRNDEEEKTCDKYAAEILMPEKEFLLLAREMKISEKSLSSKQLQKLGDRFAVSSVSTLRRLYELKEISYSSYQMMYDVLNREFEEVEKYAKGKDDLRIKYHIRYLNKEGYLLPRSIINAYGRGEISYGEMCQALNVKSKHIDSIERAVLFS